MSEEFENVTGDFIRENCGKFVETEENTHEMWLIHKKYKGEVEKFIDAQVKREVPGYSQERFIQLLKGREEQIDEYIVDTFAAFDNFNEFKRQALEMKLRQIREEDEAKYLQIISQHKGYSMIQEIASGLEMEGACLQVKGLERADGMLDN